MSGPVGVLAVQGDFLKHVATLKRLRVPCRTVRWPLELKGCSGLILPGGESTAFMNLLRQTGLAQAILSFSQEHAVMGTCAGLIALSARLIGNSMETLGLLDIAVERNAYGRQVDSFFGSVKIPQFREEPQFEGIFIRAPKIRSMGRDIQALGFLGEETVMVRDQRILGCTFHPELTRDTRVHRFFVEQMVTASG
jgi:5'-phosphate synthase pdxT subunit